MLIALHKNARTTPAVRAEIAASSETAPVLAQRFGITEQTVYKWKKRSVFGGRSHMAHRLQDAVQRPAQRRKNGRRAQGRQHAPHDDRARPCTVDQ